MPAIAFESRLAVPFARAVDQVTAALAAEGFGILTRIDVDTTLKEKLGATFRRYVILGACNPPLAQRALEAEAAIGLLMPCNVTVEQAPDGEGVIVRMGNPDELLAAGGLLANPTIAAISRDVYGRLERASAALSR